MVVMILSNVESVNQAYSSTFFFARFYSYYYERVGMRLESEEEGKVLMSKYWYIVNVQSNSGMF